MDVGVIIPTTDPLPHGTDLVRMAREAEDLGADSLWVNDHLLMVDPMRSSYPYSRDGLITWPPEQPQYEALVTCAYLMAATHHVRIGTAVLVLPQRNVLELAKTVATLDQLGGGRLELGIGIGWLAEEMEALGYRFWDRAARAEEMIDVLRSCWSGHPPAYEGAHVSVPAGVVLQPRPARPDGPRLLVGGISRAARRRAARLGDGWLAVARAEELRPEFFEQGLDELTTLRRGDAPALRTVLKVHCSASHERLLPRTVETAGALGFDEVVLELPWCDRRRATSCLRDVVALGRSWPARP